MQRVAMPRFTCLECDDSNGRSCFWLRGAYIQQTWPLSEKVSFKSKNLIALSDASSFVKFRAFVHALNELKISLETDSSSKGSFRFNKIKKSSTYLKTLTTLSSFKELLKALSNFERKMCHRTGATLDPTYAYTIFFFFFCTNNSSWNSPIVDYRYMARSSRKESFQEGKNTKCLSR